jgi:hypothetical protein
MFSTLARALATGVFGDGSLNNAVLESFTVHARVLLDFLFADKPRPDDVVAEDFFPTPEQWPMVRGDMPPILKDVDTRVGKEIAHLTYARLTVTPDKKQWRFVQIAVAIEGIIKLFVDNVPRPNLGDAWRGAVNPS